LAGDWWVGWFWCPQSRWSRSIWTFALYTMYSLTSPSLCCTPAQVCKVNFSTTTTATDRLMSQLILMLFVQKNFKFDIVLNVLTNPVLSVLYRYSRLTLARPQQGTAWWVSWFWCHPSRRLFNFVPTNLTLCVLYRYSRLTLARPQPRTGW
jgi:hypothetical protein